jgi:hypothetical protein
MFVMTQAAGGYLHSVLDRAQVPEETAIRFVIEGESLNTRLDTVHPGDATFDHDGRKVLLLDEQVSQLLDTSTLDLQPTPEGERLVLKA